MRGDEEEILIRDDSGLLYDESASASVAVRPRPANWCQKITKTLCFSLAFFVMGACIAVPGPTLLDLAEKINTDIPHISSVFSARAVGYLVGAILGGALFNYFDKQLLMFCTLMMVAVATIVVPWCLTLVAMASLIALQGVGLGILYTGGNIFCVKLWGRKNAPYLQILHFAFALGAFLAPILAMPFLSNDNLFANTTAVSSEHVSSFNKTRTIRSEVYYGGLNYYHKDFEEISRFMSKNENRYKRESFQSDTTTGNTKMIESPSPALHSSLADTSVLVPDLNNASINISAQKHNLKVTENVLNGTDIVTKLIESAIVQPTTPETVITPKVSKPLAASDSHLNSKTADAKQMSNLKPETEDKTDNKPETAEQQPDKTVSENNDKMSNKTRQMISVTPNPGGNLTLSSAINNITVNQSSQTGRSTTVGIIDGSPETQHETVAQSTLDTSKPMKEEKTSPSTSVHTSTTTATTTTTTPKPPPTTTSTQKLPPSTTTTTPKTTTTTTPKTTTTTTPKTMTTTTPKTTITTIPKPTVSSTTNTPKPTPPPITTTTSTLKTIPTTTTATTTTTTAPAVTTHSPIRTKEKPKPDKNLEHTSVASTKKKDATENPQPTKTSDTVHKSSVNISDVTTVSTTAVISTKVPKKPTTAEDIFNNVIGLVKTISKVQFVYAIIGTLAFAICILFLILYCKNKKRLTLGTGEDYYEGVKRNSGCFKATVLFMLFAFFFCYVGLEVAFGGLVTTFTVRFNHWPKEQGAIVTALFWGAVAVGRGISIFISRCCRPTAMLVVDLCLMVFGSLVLSVGTYFYSKLLWLGSLILGFGMSSVLPGIISWTEMYFSSAGKSTAVIVIGSVLGEMFFPVLTTYLFTIQDEMVLMRLALALSAILTILFIVMSCYASRSGESYTIRDRNGFLPLQAEDNEDENVEMDLMDIDTPLKRRHHRKKMGDSESATLISDLEED